MERAVSYDRLCAHAARNSLPLRYGPRPIESVQLSPGGGNCVAPLAPGHYEIAPIAPELDRKVCVIPAQLDVAAPSRSTTTGSSEAAPTAP